jgi:hypothetical protein
LALDSLALVVRPLGPFEKLSSCTIRYSLLTTHLRIFLERIFDTIGNNQPTNNASSDPKTTGDYVEVKEHYMCDHNMIVLIRIVSLGREPTKPKPRDPNCGTNNCQYNTTLGLSTTCVTRHPSKAGISAIVVPLPWRKDSRRVESRGRRSHDILLRRIVGIPWQSP